MKNVLKKLVKDPGVLFSAANVFAFSQSGNIAALSIAVATFALAADQCCNHGRDNKTGPRLWLDKVISKLPSSFKGDPNSPALRVNAYGVLAAGLLSLSSGAILPGIAGLAFAGGNFLASSVWSQNIQRNPEFAGAKKALTNPAVHYGVGYAMIGLMAGGGLQLVSSPLQHLPAFITTTLGVGATTLSTIGLTLGKFKNPAAPFMTVAFGGIINTASGVLSGNYQGAINNFIAMCGETRLGQINYHIFKAQQKTKSVPDGSIDPIGIKEPNPQQTSSSRRFPADGFFNFVSRHLLRPLEEWDQVIERKKRKQSLNVCAP